MRIAIAVVVLMMFCSMGYALDVTVKDLPDGISEANVKEWVAVLVERYHTQKVQQIPEFVAASTQAKADIDAFRKANALEEKFKTEAVAP